MISRVVIKNFKSIGEAGVDLALKPLTLLVGPNGSGKSSILEAIAVASQEGEIRPRRGEIRHPRLTNFPDWRSVIHRPNAFTGMIEVAFDLTNSDDVLGLRVNFPAEGNRLEHLQNSSVTSDADVRVKINQLTSGFRSGTFLLSSVRGDVAYSSDTSSIPEWVGVHGDSLLLLLAIIFGQRRYKAIEYKITRWAARFGIGEINAGLLGGNQSGSDYLDSELKAALDLALASSGAKQVLTIITQLFWAPEGSLLMIEEPEISLHPQAQIDVLEMFGEAIRENKQIIATTHSVFMLQALGYAVHKGWLKPEQIAVYHVQKGEGGSTATLLPLDEHGNIQDWVPSFTEVERRLLLEWAETLPRA